MWTPSLKAIRIGFLRWPLIATLPLLLFAGCAKPLPTVPAVIPQPPAGAMVAPSRGHSSNALTDIQYWQASLTNTPIS